MYDTNQDIHSLDKLDCLLNLLLQKLESDVNTNDNGFRALDFSASQNKLDCLLNLLLGNLLQGNLESNVNTINDNGYRALELSASQNQENPMPYELIADAFPITISGELI